MMAQTVHKMTLQTACDVAGRIAVPGAAGGTMAVVPKTLRNRSRFDLLIPTHLSWDTIKTMVGVSTQKQAVTWLRAVTWRTLCKPNHPSRPAATALLAAAARCVQHNHRIASPGYNPLDLALQVLNSVHPCAVCSAAPAPPPPTTRPSPEPVVTPAARDTRDTAASLAPPAKRQRRFEALDHLCAVAVALGAGCLVCFHYRLWMAIKFQGTVQFLHP